MAAFPDRLLAVGDAVSNFNPVYGQGMTAAALGADILQQRLREGTTPQWRPFFRDLAGALDAPWEISATSDLSYPEVEGRRTMKVRMMNSYMAKLQAAAVHDADLAVAFFRTAGLIDPPQTLMRPGRIYRVLTKSRWPVDTPSHGGDHATDTVARPTA
jgi:hypothetical protein